MYTLNQLTIIGFTGHEADVHYTTNGTLVVMLSVATKQSWKDAEGARAERTGAAQCCSQKRQNTVGRSRRARL